MTLPSEKVSEVLLYANNEILGQPVHPSSLSRVFRRYFTMYQWTARFRLDRVDVQDIWICHFVCLNSPFHLTITTGLIQQTTKWRYFCQKKRDFYIELLKPIFLGKIIKKKSNCCLLKFLPSMRSVKKNGYTWQIYCHLLQGGQLLWLPVCFPDNQAPEKGSTLQKGRFAPIGFPFIADPFSELCPMKGISIAPNAVHIWISTEVHTYFF